MGEFFDYVIGHVPKRINKSLTVFLRAIVHAENFVRKLTVESCVTKG